jgi:amino acid transporter
MRFLRLLKNIIIGKPLNAASPQVKEHIALIAVIAWIGLGADGLSSSAYGPEEAYLALGHHTGIAIYLAFATAFTVFLISFAYNQVIELFPSGGGGYKVATHLLGPNAGVISGSALIIDYVLTIAVSVASGVDAVFSLLPTWWLNYKLEVEIAVIVLLMILNLRGMKESIRILIPLFLGFLLTHLAVILVGILFHVNNLSSILPNASAEASSMSASMGIFATLAIFLKAYSLGGGTYTGLEAVSNNVNMLAEPRVRTGKFTMLYMALSLSFTAGGIIILYLLWHAEPVFGQTLNAVVFDKILAEAGFSHHWLAIILFFEAALLFVGANTGFLGCPAVMANMAVDKWLPRQFRELSGRLVTQNGVLISGIAAIIILLWARGRVSTLVVLYSINVFLTFSLSLLGLCVYWLRVRKEKPIWWRKFIVAVVGFVVCASILVVTTVEKFTEGGWLTVVITACTIGVCFLIRKHYREVGAQLKDADHLFASHFKYTDLDSANLIPVENNELKTAVFFVTKHYGAGLHTLLWVQRMFPGVFKNFVFITSGEIDSEAFANEEVFKKKYRQDLNRIIEGYRYFCTMHDLPSSGYFSYGVNGLDELIKLSEQIQIDYPDCVFFGGKLVFVDESWWTRLLHNNTVNLIQRQLHLRGMQMVILPMKI